MKEEYYVVSKVIRLAPGADETDFASEGINV